MDAIFTLYALTAIRKSCETLKGIGLLMNDQQEGGSIITSLTNTIKDLRSRLADVEKELKLARDVVEALRRPDGHLDKMELSKVAFKLTKAMDAYAAYDATRVREGE